MLLATLPLSIDGHQIGVQKAKFPKLGLQRARPNKLGTPPEPKGVPNATRLQCISEAFYVTV